MLFDDFTLLSFRFMKKIILFLVILCVCLSFDMYSQCPMCRMSAETNLNEGGDAGLGLNKGIIYLLTIPYILVGTIAFLWWRNNELIKYEEAQLEINELLDPLPAYLAIKKEDITG